MKVHSIAIRVLEDRRLSIEQNFKAHEKYCTPRGIRVTKRTLAHLKKIIEFLKNSQGDRIAEECKKRMSKTIEYK